MAEDLNVILKARLNITQSVDTINAQIKLIEQKLNSLNLNLKINNDGINNVGKVETAVKNATESAQELKKVFNTIDIGKNNNYIKGYDELKNKVQKIRDNVDELAKVKFDVTMDENGQARIDKALLTYNNDAHQVVQTMMELKEVTDSLGQKYWDFVQNPNLTFFDNPEKQKKDLEDLNKGIEKFKINTQNLQTNFNDKSSLDILKFSEKLDKVSLSNLIGGIKDLQTRIQNLSTTKIINDDDLDKAKLEFNAIKSKYQEILNIAKLDEKINAKLIEQKATQSKTADYFKEKVREVYLFEEKISNLSAMKGLDTSNYSSELKSVKAELAILGNDDTLSLEQQKYLIETIIQRLKDKADAEVKSLGVISKQEDLLDKIQNGINMAEGTKLKNSGYNENEFQRLIGLWEELRAKVNAGVGLDKVEKDIKKVTTATRAFKTTAEKASDSANTLGSRLKKAFQYFTFYDALQLGKRGIKDMVDVIFDLDDALVDLQKVSDLSGNSLKNFTSQAYTLGSKISKTGSEVIRASTAFAKAGYGDDELLGLAEASLKLTSIGDGLTDVSESAETLISVMRGFGKDTSQVVKIMDAINNVSNNSAVNFSDVTMALQRMSGVMNASNISMEQSIGMFTAINEVLRNTEMSSTSINSISMRLRGLEEDGTAIDGLVPKLQDMYKTIAGIDMTDANGQLKNMYELAGELAPVWGTLTENQREYIAQESAGLRQAKSFLIMMENYNRVLEVTSLAYNSAGSAEQEFIKWQSSLEGRMNNLKSSIEQFASKTINSEFVKSIINATISIVNFGTACGGLIPILTALGLAFAVLKLGIHFKTFQALKLAVVGLGAKIAGLGTALMGLAPFIGVATLIAVGILAISFAINKVKQQATEAKNEVNALSEKLKTLNGNSETINGLGTRLDELKKIKKETGLSNEEQKEFIDIQNQLKTLLPTVNGFYDNQGNFIIDETINLEKLNEVQKETIRQIREELSLKAKKSLGYTINDFDNEKQRVENLKRYLELAKKSEQGIATSDELEQANLLEYVVDVKFNTKDIELELAKVKDAIDGSLSEIRENIRNQMMGSDMWNGLGDDMQNAVLKALEVLGDTSIENWSKGIKDGSTTVKDFTEYLMMTHPALQYMSDALAKSKENANGLKTEVSDLSLTLSTFAEKQDAINKVKEELKDGNNLSLENIQSLIKAYPILETVLTKYLNGLASTSDVMKEVNKAYEDDRVKFKNTIIEKELENEDFYNNVVNVNGQLVKTMKENYGIDLGNCKSLAKAKLEVEAQTVKDVAGIWALYYDSASGMFNSNFELLDKWKNTGMGSTFDAYANETTSKLKTVKTELDKRYEAMNEIAMKGVKIPKTSNSSSSSSSKEDATTKAFEKEYKKLQYQRDKNEISLEQYYNTLEALNNKYFANSEKYLDQYRQYDLEVYNGERQLAEQRITDMQNNITMLSQNGTDDALWKQVVVYKQIQDEVHKLAEDARKRGISENNEYIQSLISQWWDAENKITALKMESFDLSNGKLDDRVVQVELRQKLVGESTKEYAELEKEKYNITIERETLLQKKIRELQAIGTTEAKAQAEDLINTYYDVVSEKVDIIKNLQDMEIESLQLQKDGIEDLHDFTMQMIESELESKKESYQEEIDSINEVFDAKKKAIQNKEDERDYNIGLTEKTDNIARLENELALISNDETQVAKQKEIEKELADAKTDLAEYQHDHSIELTIDALDTEQELETGAIEDKIELIDETLSDEVEMNELANERIRESGENLFDDLIGYAQEYGTITEDEVTTAWENATTSVNGFSTAQEGLLETLKLVTAELAKIDGISVENYANTEGLSIGYSRTDDEIINNMKANASTWTTVRKTTNTNDTPELEALKAENIKLASELGLNPNDNYDSATGIWYWDKEHKRRVYHSGGVVGGNKYLTKSSEELAKLLKGEFVLTEPMTDKVVDMITNNNNKTEQINPVINFYFDGDVDENIVDLIKKEAKNIANIIVAEMQKARTDKGMKKPVKA